MINSQKNLFDSFRINSNKAAGVPRQIVGVKAVIEIEDEIERIRANDGDDNKVIEYLEHIDSSDQIFGLTRAFYIMVKMIFDKLSDTEGFSLDDRKAHFLTLVNFTDFAQLRLIMICTQFMSYESAEFLRNCGEFRSVIEELGLGYELY